ncbi:hypothetical protein BH10ACT11_BH10ACT11_01740 [soil metagenome]
MGSELRSEARFPGVAAGDGHYESFYVKANDPAGGRAVWLRHTFHQAPGAEPSGSIWLTVFDSASGKPRATKVTYPASEISAPDGAYVKVAGAGLEPGRAAGQVDGASWELNFDAGAEPLRHLDRDLFYRSRLPKTKLLSPNPNSSFSGHVELDGRRLELEAWPGMVGHNWGSEHAKSWIWLQASGFDGEAHDYLDVALGRVKVLGRTTPWVPNGRIVLEGTSYRLGGLRNTYGAEITETPTGCEFTIPGKDINVKGRVGAKPEEFVAWIYADPGGGEHHALNCSVADIELRIERPGARHAKFSAKGTAVYELGTSDTDHPIAVQPFTDG